MFKPAEKAPKLMRRNKTWTISEGRCSSRLVCNILQWGGVVVIGVIVRINEMTDMPETDRGDDTRMLCVSVGSGD